MADFPREKRKEIKMPGVEDFRKEREQEIRCRRENTKIWVSGYVKVNGDYVLGYCRDRKDHEIPHPPKGVKPFINTASGQARYHRTVTDRDLDRGDYSVRSGFYVLHPGNNRHHVYALEE